MKDRRQRAILTLVATRPIHSQEELVTLLHRQGFEVTQATVSRDIKELRLTKVPITVGRRRRLQIRGAERGDELRQPAASRDGRADDDDRREREPDRDPHRARQRDDAGLGRRRSRVARDSGNDRRRRHDFDRRAFGGRDAVRAAARLPTYEAKRRRHEPHRPGVFGRTRHLGSAQEADPRRERGHRHDGRSRRERRGRRGAAHAPHWRPCAPRR